MSPTEYVVEASDWHSMRPQDQAAIDFIFNEVFPPQERPAIEVVVATGSEFWVGRVGAEIRAFAAAVELGQTRTVLLQYLGVDPRQQSHGMGSAILERLLEDLRERNMERLVLEIEYPYGADATLDAKRRLGFYERWSAHPIKCLREYFIPDLTDPKNRVSMLLLWKPVRATSDPRGSILRGILAAIYHSEYAHLGNPNHLADLLAAVEC